MSQIALFPEKPTRSIAEFEFLQDPKDKNSKLGVGSFATVKLARERKHNKLIALKMVDLETSKSRTADLHNLRTEVHIHRRIDHPNIIKYHGYTQEGYCIYIVLDYAEKGNLYSYIHKRKILSPNEIFRFFYQTCLAIQYLHKQDVMHRDLKPENLLLDKDLNIKLCDFGWATERIKEKRTTFCGTYEYMAPEIVHKRPYDYHIDIWSLGILLYELIHREAPYKGRSLSEIHNSLSKGTITYSPTCDPQARDLIQRILKINPSDRPSMAQILSHPFVKQHLPSDPTKEAHGSGHKALKHDITDHKVDKENHHHHHHEKLLLASERPLTSAEYVQKSLRKPSGWKPTSPHHSEIRRRPQEEQCSEVSGRTHTKSSSSLSKMVLETLDSEDKRFLSQDIHKARKITELKGLSPTLKRSLQSIVSPPNRITPPDQAPLSEVFTTKNIETPNNISTLLENFSAYGTTGPQPSTGLPSYNNLSSVERAGTANITAGSVTSISSHVPVIVDQSRALGPSKKFRTLTTNHTPTNSRLFCSPTTPQATSSTTMTTATTRAPSHHKALTVINENELPRRVVTENQGNMTTSNRVMYKGNRFIISPRVLETSASAYENVSELPRTLGSLISPVGWTRRKLANAKSIIENYNFDEDALKPVNVNLINERPEADNVEGKEEFGINFNRFVKGEYRPKTVAKGAEGARMRIVGVKKMKGNKENKIEGEKKIKRLMSLEKLYTPRDVRLQFINL